MSQRPQGTRRHESQAKAGRGKTRQPWSFARPACGCTTRHRLHFPPRRLRNAATFFLFAEGSASLRRWLYLVHHEVSLVWIKRLQSAAMKPFLVRLSLDTDGGPKPIPPAREHWACARPAGSNYSGGHFLARRGLLELRQRLPQLVALPSVPCSGTWWASIFFIFYFFAGSSGREKLGCRES